MMMPVLLSTLVGQPVTGRDLLVSGISLNSREVGPGNLFLAVKGERVDGHQYIDDAIARGAVAVAVENEEFVKDRDITYVVSPLLKKQVGQIAARFYGEPTERMCIVGVTGTNGKTSITSYVRQLFALFQDACGEIGTLGIHYNDTHMETQNTTPDAVTLQKHFYTMLQQGVTRVAMEVSSHAMEQDRCQGIHFSAAIYSNISHDHLDYHGSFPAYIQAKSRLFSLPDLPLAVVNIDDNASTRMMAVVGKQARVVTYSLKDSKADAYLSGITRNGGVYRANLHYRGKDLELRTGLVGEFNLYNLVAAAVTICELGYPVEDVISACQDVRPVAGRMQLIENPHGIAAIVDYAHTPDAMENVLKTIRKLYSGRIITVFGCGGDRDREKRPIMAAIAEKYSDYVVITADNPRNESIPEIMQQIEAGMDKHNADYCVCEDRRQAIELAVSMATANDCILVAGKGHEKKQIIGDKTFPFDDAQVLADALVRKGSLTC